MISEPLAGEGKIAMYQTKIFCFAATVILRFEGAWRVLSERASVGIWQWLVVAVALVVVIVVVVEVR